MIFDLLFCVELSMHYGNFVWNVHCFSVSSMVYGPELFHQITNGEETMSEQDCLEIVASFACLFH